MNGPTGELKAWIAALMLGCLTLLSAECGTADPPHDVVLLSEDFSQLEPGLISAPVGPHTEYHYLPEAAPHGQWAVSCFTWEDGSREAWRRSGRRRG